MPRPRVWGGGRGWKQVGLLGIASALPLQCSSGLAGAQGLALEQRRDLAQRPDLEPCIRRLDPQVDIGYERVAARCPELTRLLEQSGLVAWLPKDWKESHNDLSAGGLRQLEELAARELATRSGVRTADPSRLRPVLAELNTVQPQQSWWARFKAWLRSALESSQRTSGDDWLSSLSRRLRFSTTILNLISYTALTAVVLLAGVIITNELRVSGALTRVLPLRRRGAIRQRSVDGHPPATHLEVLDLTERPRLLLELIATRLSDPLSQPPSRALTVRELAASLPVGDKEDRSSLLDLARAAEQVRFSGREVPTAFLEATLVRGVALLERLQMRAAASRGAAL